MAKLRGGGTSVTPLAFTLGLLAFVFLTVSIVINGELDHQRLPAGEIVNLYGERVNLPPKRIYRVTFQGRTWLTEGVSYSYRQTQARFQTWDGAETCVSAPYLVESVLAADCPEWPGSKKDGGK